LIKWKIPRVLAIAISLIITSIIFAALITFLSAQFASFADLVPELQKRFSEIWQDVQQWARSTVGLSYKEQAGMLDEGLQQGKSLLGTTLFSVANMVGTLILLPIYVFLILYYKPMFINFFYEVFDYKHGKRVSEVLTETKSAVQSYIQGLMI